MDFSTSMHVGVCSTGASRLSVEAMRARTLVRRIVAVLIFWLLYAGWAQGCWFFDAGSRSFQGGS
jgi:hypothetical protein